MKFKAGDKVIPVDFDGVSGRQLERFRGLSYVTVEKVSINTYESLIYLKEESQSPSPYPSKGYLSDRFIPYVEPENMYMYIIIYGENEMVKTKFTDIESAISYGKSINASDNFAVFKFEKAFAKEKVITWKEVKVI